VSCDLFVTVFLHWLLTFRQCVLKFVAFTSLLMKLTYAAHSKISHTCNSLNNGMKTMLGEFLLTFAIQVIIPETFG
jgi:hypothetical protein